MSRPTSAPAGRPAQVLRMIAELLAPYLRDKLGREPGPDPVFYSQHDSPLGRRRHLELVRSGVLAGHKVGRRVLVRREAIHAYIEAQQPGSLRPASEDQDVLSDWGLKAKGER